MLPPNGRTADDLFTPIGVGYVLRRDNANEFINLVPA
jgi:hypothetical protein